ncbi:Pathogenesis-related protein 1 [Citrus sinensis]|nr:Pathogenesis-related protein 1 [Citrus sinensis]
MAAKYEIEKFNGNNFSLWKINIKVVLRKNNYLAAIGEKSMEITDDKWNEIDDNAIFYLHLALADGVLSSVAEKKTAKEIWYTLTKLYEAKSLHNNIFLKMRLYTLRMAESTSVIDRINTLKTLFSQLTMLSHKIEENERAELLFQSLPDSYDQFIINLTKFATSRSTISDEREINGTEAITVSEDKKRLSDFWFTVAYTPQQNGVAERMNRTLTEMIRAMLMTVALPNSFWVEATKTACYIVNQSPSTAIGLKTMMEMWTGSQLIIHTYMYLDVLSTTQLSSAQNSQQDYLRAHNEARASVRVGPMRWDNKVAAYAQNYANQRKGDCRLVHSGGPYGENLAWSSGDLTGTAAVKLWVDERPKYNYNSNTCVGGECRHYTQVVWRNSVRLGCARVKCNNNRGTFVICSYDPPGNVAGKRPY